MHSGWPAKEPYVCEWLRVQGHMWPNLASAPPNKYTDVFMDGRGVAMLSSVQDRHHLFEKLARDITSTDIEGRVSLCERLPRIEDVWNVARPPPELLVRRAVSFFDRPVELLFREAFAHLQTAPDRDRMQLLITILRGIKDEQTEEVEETRARTQWGSPIASTAHDWSAMRLVFELDYGDVKANGPNYEELIQDATEIATVLTVFGLSPQEIRTVMMIVEQEGNLGVHLIYPLTKLWPEQAWELANHVIRHLMRRRPQRGSKSWDQIVDLSPYTKQLRCIGVQKASECKACHTKSRSASSRSDPHCQVCRGHGRMYIGRRYFPTCILDFTCPGDQLRSEHDEAFFLRPKSTAVQFSTEHQKMQVGLIMCSPRLHDAGMRHIQFSQDARQAEPRVTNYPRTWSIFFHSVIDAAARHGLAPHGTLLNYCPWSTPAGEDGTSMSNSDTALMQTKKEAIATIRRRQALTLKLEHMLGQNETVSDMALKMLKEFETDTCKIARGSPKDNGKCAAIETWLRSHAEYSRIFVFRVVHHKGGNTSVLVTGSRFCHMRGREHKSNGIYFDIFQLRGEVVQRCYDDECNREGRAGRHIGFLLDSVPLMLLFCPAKLLELKQHEQTARDAIKRYPDLEMQLTTSKKRKLMIDQHQLELTRGASIEFDHSNTTLDRSSNEALSAAFHTRNTQHKSALLAAIMFPLPIRSARSSSSSMRHYRAVELHHHELRIAEHDDASRTLKRAKLCTQ